MSKLPAVSGASLVFAALAAISAHAQMKWIAQAPGPNTNGQVESVVDGEVVGAINSIATHPTDPNIVYVGAVNGGIWRTDNASAAAPSWRALTDAQGSNSIGALELDPTDATSQTLVAGVGRFSSLRGEGGERIGAFRTTNGGASWSAIDPNRRIAGLNIVGVAPRGQTVIIAANTADSPGNAGLWRTVNLGVNWVRVSSAAGLAAGPITDLISDPSDPSRLYTIVRGAGIYRSDNAGQSWIKVSNAVLDGLIGGADNAKGAVGASSVLFVAIVQGGSLAGVYRSADTGKTWSSMEVPRTSEGGAHIGFQGSIHLSIAADPQNTNVVYIGGDRQPSEVLNDRETGRFPNSIGARDYSGRLFRGDASKPSGQKWVHLTHSNSLGAAGGGTASGSAPHADSRDMAFAADGNLLEADDGGIYRRTSPHSNAGDWFSMNGDLQATEFHSVAWDSNVHLVIGGAQDTGTPQQRIRADVKWQTVSSGDGGVVGVDDTSTPGLSTRYSSYQYLSDLRRDTYDATNTLQARVILPLRVSGGGRALDPQFYTPIRLNTTVPTRLVFGGANGVYESLDEGDTIEEVGSGIVANETGPQSIAYGAAGNADALYVASGNRVFVRTGAAPAALMPSGTYPGARVLGIAMNPSAAATAYTVDQQQVFRTTNFGQTWTNITGNLPQLRAGVLRSIAYVTFVAVGAVVVGSDRGVFEASGPAFNVWRAVGTGLPVVPVYYLEYDPGDRVLLAGTLGRGAWTLQYGAAPPPAAPGAAPGPLPAAAVPPPPVVQDPSVGAVELRPGVLVQPSRNAVYLMTPNGSTEALDIRTGQQLWSNQTVAKPLGLVDGRLLVQAENTGTEVLRIVMVDAATGQSLLNADRPLPAGVRSSVSETVNGSFVAAARMVGNQPIISWEFQERRRRGIPPGTDTAVTGNVGPQPAGTGAAQSRSGAFRIDMSSGATLPADGPGPSPAMVARSNPIPAPERVATLPSPQLLSADNRHVLVSERVANASVFERYKLSFFDRSSLRQIGTITSHLAQFPFLVQGTLVIFETGPYSRSLGGALVNESLKVRCIDLETGKELWSRPIRETVLRTPPPA